MLGTVKVDLMGIHLDTQMGIHLDIQMDIHWGTQMGIHWGTQKDLQKWTKIERAMSMSL